MSELAGILVFILDNVPNCCTLLLCVRGPLPVSRVTTNEMTTLG